MSESQLRQLSCEGDEILQKQWERVVAAFRADVTLTKLSRTGISWKVLFDRRGTRTELVH